MLLNDFTINYRGVGITPQLEHRFDGDVLKLLGMWEERNE